MSENRKIIGVVLAYNCATMVERAIQSIPREYFDDVICVDDGSSDNTVAAVKKTGVPVFTHDHTGYGGNLVFGFQKALERGATHVFELHGDGQYDFAAVPPAIQCLENGCDLVLGNRFPTMLQPLREGMDLVRYFGNIFLSLIARVGLGKSSRDFFPGFRAYSRKFITEIALKHAARGSQNYFFSFEIIALAHYMGLKIGQIPVRCDYKGEHTSMHLSKGGAAILHTTTTVLNYRLARLGMPRGIYSPFTPSSSHV